MIGAVCIAFFVGMVVGAAVLLAIMWLEGDR